MGLIIYGACAFVYSEAHSQLLI